MSAADRLEQLFTSARALAPAERGEWLASRCGDDRALRDQLDELLASHDASWPLLDRPVVDRLAALGGAPADDGPLPEQLGDFRIHRRLGSGSSGSVYEATQLPGGRRVALKVLRPSLAADAVRQRFLREGALLRSLDHPAIARIYEEGSFDLGLGPHPYLAMELVRGVPLDEHCAHQEPDPAQRLQLLIDLSEAVAHAHERGILHRDLKPANILVDSSGRPHVLDFGLGRLVDPLPGASSELHTRTGQLIGTLQYMSPEQVRADGDSVDGRSDLHALGVIAFELFAGRPPYRVDRVPLDEALRRIVRVDAPALDGLVPDLPAGLAVVVARSLQKDRDDRYATVRDWLDDLRRVAARQAIAARAPPPWVQWRRLARRHPTTARAIAATSAALLGGLLLASLGWWDAHDQERLTRAALQREQGLRAELESSNRSLREALDEAEQMLAVLEGTWESLEPIDGQREWTARDVLDHTARQLAEGAALDGRTAARLHASMADAYTHIGHPQQATAHHAEAVALADEHFGPAHAFTLARQAAAVHHAAGQGGAGDAATRARERADQLAAQGVDVPGRIVVATAELTSAPSRGATTGELDARYGEYLDEDVSFGERVVLVVHQARVWREQGRFVEATEALETLLAEAREQLGPRHQDSVTVTLELGLSLERLGAFERAEALVREARGWLLETHGAGHHRTLAARQGWASILFAMKRTDAAAREMADVVARTGERFGAEHVASIAAQSLYANILSEAGELERAAPLAEAVERHTRALHGDLHQDTVAAMLSLATLRVRQQREDDALALYAAAVEVGEAQGYLTSRNKALLGAALAQARLGRAADAVIAAGRAADAFEAHLGRGQPVVREIRLAQARLLDASGDPEQAARQYLAVMDETLGAADPANQWALCGLASTRVLGADPGRAEAMLTTLLDATADAALQAECRYGLGRVAARLGRHARSAELLADVVAHRARVDGPAHVVTLRALADWLAALGQLAGTEPARAALDGLWQRLGRARPADERAALGELLEGAGFSTG